MSTPLSRTGAPLRSPLVLSKNDTSVMRCENKPLVPDIRNKSSANTRLAIITVMPTRSSDHLICF